MWPRRFSYPHKSANKELKEAAIQKQQTCNIVLTPSFNPLRCSTAGKVFISDTPVNKYKKAFACSGQSRAAQNLKAPPTASGGPQPEPV
ncbi:hypothetical protein FV313_22130 [Escherichia coli]|uniref:Uncharacterized protein n=1 Tax=Salmonella enterica TaxID=28901 RepID=A0A746IFZ3_SALER|nr:hypothetical protein [Salmonella enterica subsp. enterica serovar Dublin]EEW0960274.1 hypothetical protein [Escherichia coli]HAF3372991.1 hypothetical protein [Salmonella enterica]ECD7094181.1 hypothetical protein [Salmonella enterica subsp. enterica serovar Dublin]ECF3923079.1 hypothetical protein [Salmonella enterica subsp. enterica serovar Dublin]